MRWADMDIGDDEPFGVWHDRVLVDQARVNADISDNVVPVSVDVGLVDLEVPMELNFLSYEGFSLAQS